MKAAKWVNKRPYEEQCGADAQRDLWRGRRSKLEHAGNKDPGLALDTWSSSAAENSSRLKDSLKAQASVLSIGGSLKR